MIERPERLIIVLLGAGLSGRCSACRGCCTSRCGLLAVASLITLGQRVHSVRTSPGAMDRLTKPTAPPARRDVEAPPPAAQGDES